MRISDWSSDVCSSDLPAPSFRRGGGARICPPAVQARPFRSPARGPCIESWRSDHHQQRIRLRRRAGVGGGELDALMLAFATYGYGIAMVFLTGFLLGRAMRLAMRLIALAVCLVAPPLLEIGRAPV